MRNEEKEKFYLPMFLFALFVTVLNIYWFGYELFDKVGLKSAVFADFFRKLNAGGFFKGTYVLKLWALGFLFFTFFVKAGKNVTTPWRTIVWILISGLLLFFFPFFGPLLYIFTTSSGFFLTAWGIALVGRKVNGLKTDVNDDRETFEQCEKLIEDDLSVNIPTRYFYKGKERDGWINVVMPNGGVLISGAPGTGKSYAVYGYFLSQLSAKGASFILYDYKSPELSTELYNFYLMHKDDVKPDGSYLYPVKPEFHFVNFDDPRYSERCNPFHPRLLKEPADAAEIADLIMSNVSGSEAEKKDFFFQSACVFITCIIWFLRSFEDGRYCTLPHLIELMGRNYKAVFRLLQKREDLKVMMAPFANALSGKAQEQLQGQIASAQIPLARFASPSLYWVLSGDDFSLDANNPDAPKYIAFGNNPERQQINGTTLSLIMARIFKTINQKTNAVGKRNLPCAVILDEMPTIYLRDVPSTLNTARSNGVCLIMGVQDESQLIKDYDQKNADVIFNTVGSIISGRVNGGTAKRLSETFGKEKREHQSLTSGGEHDTMNRSFQLEERLPQSRIETLSQGYFCGKVADKVGKEVDKKLFCGKIIVEKNRKEFLENLKPLEKVSNPAFCEGEIRKRVLADPVRYCKEYLLEEYLESERQKKFNDPQYNEASADSPFTKTLVKERYDSLERKQKLKLLDDVIENELRKKMDEVLQAKYDEIKGDVINIFAKEGINEFEEEPAKPGKNIPSGMNVNDINQLNI